MRAEAAPDHVDNSGPMIRAIPTALLGLILAGPVPTRAQEPASSASQHQHHDDADGPQLFSAEEASGTAWVPKDTPMYGVEATWGRWSLMLHGTALVQYLYEPGDRHRTGGFATHQVSSVNWGMVMARRMVGAGRVGLRGMLSVEPWTVTDCGFLNLLATGETCQDDTIHDRQHPHDLFMELAAEYDRAVRGSLRWQIYGGFAGEPALGPPAFPHRVSAMPNPVAPLSHHWLDSSHITYGLITTGFYDRQWKAELSVFNGREPDENRADLDIGRLDSVAARLTVLPMDRLAMQVSAAHLNEAEAEFPPEPRSDLDRLTASATYHHVASGSRIWATTLAYGMNVGREVIPGGEVDLVTHAILLESNLTMDERHTFFGRVEAAGKPGHDLHVHEAPAAIFGVGKLQGGYVRYFRPWNGLVSGFGATASLSIVPSTLASRYGGRVAPGLGIFFTVRPPRHAM